MNLENNNIQHDKDSIANTLFMAFTVSLVCSLFVASSVILLRPIQKQNQLLSSDYLKIAQLIAELNPELSIEKIISRLDIKIIDLEKGSFTDAVDVDNYQQDEADKDPDLSIAIPDEYDIAQLKQRSRYAKIYLLNDNDNYKYVILPIYGAGMWSTLYGYIILENDSNTIAGLKFYQHAETPGIGDKIEDPNWLKQWQGKRIYNDGIVAIEITKNKTPDKALYQIDNVTGATMTMRGVNNLLLYWLGEHGYKPFLKKTKAQAK